MRSLLGSTPGRAAISAVAAIVIATLAGIAVLWPGDVDVPLPAGLLPTNTEAGEVVSERSFACQPPLVGTCQRAVVRVESGPDAGSEVELSLGGIGLITDLSAGDEVRLAPSGDTAADADGYRLADYERRGSLLLIAVAFAILAVALARWRGVLSLLGLTASIAIVVGFVVPALLDGGAALAVAIVGAFAVMLVTIPLVHGLGAKAVAAILGTVCTLLLTVGLAAVAADLAHLTGLSSDSAVLLQQSGQPELSLRGLLLAGIVIATLGVLDDMTVSQSSTVMALRATDPALGAGELFRRAMDVGRDHISATINTLVLAYVGASLPVLLIFGSRELGVGEALNTELVAREAVATMVGSMGLIAAAPITTALAAGLAVRLPVAALGGDEPHRH
jgi:uncharacterized membrane protein